jgi:hypothetical protein
MLTPLTKSIKSKANSFTFFQSSIYLFIIIIFENFDFVLCNDEVNMLWKRCKYKWWMKGGEMKIKYAMVEEGRKMKCEMTTGLFSRRECLILCL